MREKDIQGPEEKKKRGKVTTSLKPPGIRCGCPLGRRSPLAIEEEPSPVHAGREKKLGKGKKKIVMAGGGIGFTVGTGGKKKEVFSRKRNVQRKVPK